MPVEYDQWDKSTMHAAKQHYVPNPHTKQPHPYSYGFFYPRQIAPEGHELSEEDLQRNDDHLQMFYDNVYHADASSDNVAPPAPDNAPTAPPAPVASEPAKPLV